MDKRLKFKTKLRVLSDYSGDYSWNKLFKDDIVDIEIMSMDAFTVAELRTERDGAWYLNTTTLLIFLEGLEYDNMHIEDIGKEVEAEKLKIQIQADAKRRTGRTTRIADFLIQQLFEHGEIFIKNHGNEDGSLINYQLFEIIKNRLQYEHHGNKFIFQKHNLYIKLDG